MSESLDQKAGPNSKTISYMNEYSVQAQDAKKS